MELQSNNEMLDKDIENAAQNDAAKNPEKSGKPENLPEKFWDEKAGEVRVDALVNSYLALEKKLSDPAMRVSADCPECAEDYAVDVSHGLFDVDMDINRRLHNKNFSQEQAQEVYDLAAERLAPMIMEMAEDMRADREVEKLIEKFGGAEKWQEISRQLLAFGQQNLAPDVLKNLSSSYEGILALYRMMKADDPSIKPGTNGTAGAADLDLQSLMKDPKYWRDRDPATVQKVTQGFERLYGNQ